MDDSENQISMIVDNVSVSIVSLYDHILLCSLCIGFYGLVMLILWYIIFMGWLC